MCLPISPSSLPELHTWGAEGCSWHVQEVGESTPKAGAASPNTTFARRPSAAMSELEPLAEVEGEGEGGASEDPDAPEKGALPALTCSVSLHAKHASGQSCGIFPTLRLQEEEVSCCLKTIANCISTVVALQQQPAAS